MASDKSVKVIVEFQDKASKPLKAVTDQVDATKHKIDGVSASVVKSSGAFTDLTKTLTSVGVAYLALQAGGKILSFFESTIKSAMESERVQAQLGAVLKSTGQEAGVSADMAIKLSKSLENQTTFSDEAVLSAENLLLTFTHITKDVFPQATQAVLDMSIALGQDTKSSAIQLGKALQDPILGIVALRRVGVNFSESQKEVIKQMVETGKSGDAMNLILKEIEKEFGGSAAAAAATYQGRLEQLKNKWDDIKEVIGGALISAFTPALTAMTRQADEIQNNAGFMDDLSQKTYILANGLIALGAAGLMAATGVSKLFDIIAGTVSEISGAALQGVALVTKGMSLTLDYVSDKYKVKLPAVQAAIDSTTKSVYGLSNNLLDGAEALKKTGFDGSTASKEMDLFTQSVDNMGKGMNMSANDLLKQAKANKLVQEAASQSKESIDAQKKSAEELAKGFKEIVEGTSVIGIKSVEDFMRFGKVLMDTKSTNADFIKNAKEGFTSLAEKIKSTTDEITTLQKSIVKSNKDFENSQLKNQTDDAKGYADIIVNAEKDLKDAKGKLGSELGKGTDPYSSTIIDLQKSIKDKQAIVDAAANVNAKLTTDQQIALSDQLKFLRDNATKDELTQALNLSQQKSDERKKDHNDEITKINEEIIAKQRQLEEYKTVQTSMSLALAINVKIRQKSLNEEMVTVDRLTSSLNAAAIAYAALNAASNRGGIFSAQPTANSTLPYKAFASGGVVTSPTLALIGEAGPERVEPISRGGGKGGSGVTVNIHNPSVRSDADIQEIVRQVTAELSRSQELASFGSYT